MIVIKGNMPKGTGCDGCEFQTSTCEQLDACTCHLFEGTIDNFHNERQKDCPIVGEIPDKHGDLKDAADIMQRYEHEMVKLKAELPKEQYEQIFHVFHVFIKPWIDQAPTVVEASK